MQNNQRLPKGWGLKIKKFGEVLALHPTLALPASVADPHVAATALLQTFQSLVSSTTSDSLGGLSKAELGRQWWHTDGRTGPYHLNLADGTFELIGDHPTLARVEREFGVTAR